MDHAEARLLASARYDGELDAPSGPLLDEHLGTCAPCRSFAAALRRLTSLAAALPALPLPETFAVHVPADPPLLHRGVRMPSAWRSRAASAASVAAVAAVVTALIVGGLPVRTFRVAPAAATRALTTIRTLDVSRVVTERDAGGREQTTVERIRYRAPASVRIDRTLPDGTTETEIRVPGMRYRTRGGDGVLRTGVPPEANPVPEPISPTLALLGRDAGPGPVIAGRATRRVVLDQGGGIRREALLDAARSTILGADVSVVLGKQGFTGSGQISSKRVTSIRYNSPLDDSLFVAPGAPSIDEGFRTSPVSALKFAPAAAPRGFRVVQAGAGPTEESILYAKGAFTILVRMTSVDEPPRDGTWLSLPASVGSRVAMLYIALYDLPALRFRVGSQWVTISAPMDQDGLERAAEKMFPGSE